MEKQSYTNTYDHYYKMVDEYKSTGRLFGLIPFDFNYTKFTMAVYMAIPILILLLLFSFNLIGVCVVSVIYLILNIEYNRVFDYRDAILLECIWSQITWETEIRKGVPQLPDAPDYIDETDIEGAFDEAISIRKKPSFFKYAKKLLVSKINLKDEIGFYK